MARRTGKGEGMEENMSKLNKEGKRLRLAIHKEKQKKKTECTVNYNTNENKNIENETI